MPLFSFFGLWDSYLSATLYSGSTKSATLYISETVKDKLPETTRKLASKSGAHVTKGISVAAWSWEELNVPAYPEDRVFKNVARYVCTDAEEPSSVRLTIEGKPDFTNGSREVEIYDCSGLETGEHKIQKLER